LDVGLAIKGTEILSRLTFDGIFAVNSSYNVDMNLKNASGFQKDLNILSTQAKLL
jgi:hypothetical protein